MGYQGVKRNWRSPRDCGRCHKVQNDVIGEQLIYSNCKVVIKFQVSSAGETLYYQPAWPDHATARPHWAETAELALLIETSFPTEEVLSCDCLSRPRMQSECPLITLKSTACPNAYRAIAG